MSSTQEHVGFRHTVASAALDLIRGLAALLVLLDHTHNLFFLDRSVAVQASHHPLLLRVLYVFGSAGIQAVVIFFVLSGFLISGSVFRDLASGRWSWKRYLTHRLVRLWLVLVPALLLGAAWDLGRLALQGSRHMGTGLTQAPAAHLTPSVFFSNIVFLQSIHAPTFGSNRVLWSLAFEFWYYMLFPLGLLALRRQTPVRERWLYAGLVLVVCAVVGRAVLALFPVWLLGSLLARLRAPGFGPGVRRLVSVLYLAALFAFVAFPWQSRLFKQDYALGLVTTAFLWVWLSARARVEETALPARVARRLAGFSYSLYLVHYPLLAFLAALITFGHLWTPSPLHLFEAFCLVCLAVLYAWGVASLTEFQNDKVRGWVERRLAVGNAPAVAGAEANALHDVQ